MGCDPTRSEPSGASFMDLAFVEAERARLADEVPVGAVIVDPATGVLVAAAGNATERQNDPTAHAEILVIRAACAASGSPRLPGFDLYVTLEPCAMCAAAISAARLRRVYFAAYDPKGGAVEHGVRLFEQPGCLHRPELYGGIQEARAADMLRRFFATLRERGSESAT